MTKKAAIQKARSLRAQGQNVKVFEVTNVYTVPGVGITATVRYEVRPV